MNWLFGLLDVLALPQTLTGLMAIAASLVTAFGMPDRYSNRITALITSINTMAALVIAGISYERGKLNEGTVPHGARSIYDSPPTGNVASIPSIPPTSLPFPTLQSVEKAVAEKHNAAKVVILPILLCIVLSIVGCSSTMTPLTRADLAASSLDSAVQTLTIARKAGYVSDADKANISQVIHGASVALHTYEADVVANPTGTEAQRDAAAFWSAFAEVEPFVVKYLSKPQPTTKASH